MLLFGPGKLVLTGPGEFVHTSPGKLVHTGPGKLVHTALCRQVPEMLVLPHPFILPLWWLQDLINVGTV